MEAGMQLDAVCCELVGEVAASAGEVRLRVTGSSMLPAIWPGDEVTVRRCEAAELDPGQIVLYRRDGKLTAHRIKNRIQHLNGDQLITRGDSVACFDALVQASEVVGQVVRISRGGRVIDPRQESWQCAAAAILRRSRLLTRATLFLSRRLRRGGNGQAADKRSSPLPAGK